MEALPVSLNSRSLLSDERRISLGLRITHNVDQPISRYLRLISIISASTSSSLRLGLVETVTKEPVIPRGLGGVCMTGVKDFPNPDGFDGGCVASGKVFRLGTAAY